MFKNIRSAFTAVWRILCAATSTEHTYEHYRGIDVEGRRYEEKKINGEVVMAEGDPSVRSRLSCTLGDLTKEFERFEKEFERRWWRRP